ncbi:hypothetical protein OPQ81_003649 [Rhizoctonia solani]|nr:hypothetical protein OPQ81_003649 [Rhizoctonia solani]
MTPWTFNLRSSNSDIEDEEETNPFSQNITSPNAHPQRDEILAIEQKQKDIELEELFGGAEEEAVEYKPNPWSIAKINANARKTLQAKPKPKPIKKPTINAGSKSSGLERFSKNPKDLPSDAHCISGIPAGTRKRSLRDSISEALRRGKAAAIVPPDQDSQSQVRKNVARKHIKGLRSRAADTTLVVDFYQPLDGSIQPSHSAYQKLIPPGRAPHNLGAYIPDKLTAIPTHAESAHTTEDHRHLDTPDRIFSGDSYPPDESTALFQNPETREDNLCSSPYRVDDGLVPTSGTVYTPPQSSPSSRCTNTHTLNPLMVISPELRPDRISRGRVRLASPYSVSTIKTRLEPSPTVELIARCAAPQPSGPSKRLGGKYARTSVLSMMTNVLTKNQYSDSDAYREESPTFAWAAPSPTMTETIRHTPPARGQVYQPHTPEDTSHPIQKKRPATPPRKKPVERLDLDDKPLWSTLPTPPSSKVKPPANGIKTSRFRLPGSFLGK